MAYLGDFATGSTVYVYFNTFNSLGASVTITGLAVTDIEIYKDGSTTQRASEAGYTLLDTDGIDFDSLTGIHGLKIDLSDDTDAGFYAAGSEYMVMVGPITIDGQTVNVVAGHFSIERSGGALALLKSATYGLSALEALVDDLESRLTADRAGYLDKLQYLPAVTAGQAGGVFIAGTNAATSITTALTANITGDLSGSVGSVAANGITATSIATDAINAASLKADAVAEIADAVWDEASTGHTDAGKAGAQVWTDIDAILADTGTDGVVLADDAITSAKFDESTAFPLKAEDANSTYIARTGADSDTLEVLSDEIDAVSAAISAIGSGTGAALNFEVTEDNASAPIKSVTAVGTQTGTFANTLANDGTVHSIASVANAIDWIYGFDVGAARSASKVVLRANMAAVGDTVTVSAYNFVTPGWDTRTTITGTTETAYDIPLLSRNTGTGADEGKVYIRFVFSDTDAGTLVIDEAYVQAQQSGSLVGYSMGAIWVDTNASNTNTVPYVDGTADNPVSTWAAALTLSASTGLNAFRIAAGSSITLSADSSNYSIVGDGLFNLALGGQTITNAFIQHASISGIGAGSGTIFDDCQINTGTYPPAYFVRCGINTTSGAKLLAAAAGQYVFVDCVSLVAGSGTPYFDFSGTGGTTGVNFRRWSGGSNITLDSDCTMTMEVVTGGGQTVTTGGAAVEVRGICRAVTVALSASETVQIACVTGPIAISGTAVAATVNIYGVHGVVTNTSTGSTVNTLGVSRATVNAEADTALADYDPPTNAEMEARTLIAANYFDPAADTVATVTTVTTVTNLTNAPTNGDLTAAMKASVNAEVDTALNTAIPGSPTADSINQRVAAIDDLTQASGAGDLAASLTRLGTPSDLGGGASISQNLVDIEAQTDDIPTAATIADAVWDELSTGHVSAGKAGEQLWTDVDAILEDTGTTLDDLVDDLESRLTATRAGYLDNLSAGAVATQTSVNDLPTNAELTAALAAADDAVLAAIAALNNLSAAQVNAEVVDALAVDVIADSVAADGSRPTIAQAALMILRFLTEKAVVDVTATVYKEDGTTSVMTYTLNDATSPTAITRAS